ncbi:PAS domain S-box protein [Flavitalea sp. BT771]|uniref:hybrid sensor histidine kinase/response regulator n=1 Tax=Flavitalea sp. BT771 TaxID=3063329 RepID=UPI0026E2A47A|nr:PAS domain S-box protein [Flavitalea sp. BT771]MDO6430947.1 PAS domain S-box protein [Flavitalea sp. BT771]MDV6219854.1 PAS domain S-box protein [Flavitalea sp. BT771]
MHKMNNSLSILTVEDNPSDLFLVERMLRQSLLDVGKLFFTDRVGRACDILKSEEINLVLLDLTLPDSFGINSYLHLKSAVQKIPVIILTGLSDTSLAVEAIKEGAQDYLVKGEFNEKLLTKSIQYSLERKRTLENLRESNERFNTVVKATNDAIWDWDLGSNEVFLVGDAYKQLFGYDIVNAISPQDFWESILHPDDRSRVMDKLKGIIREARVTKWEDEYRLKKSNGEYAYVHDRGYIIYSPDHRPQRVIGAIQDITARKRSEEIIRTSEEKYKKIFYKNPYPTWIYDLDSLHIMEVNDAALEKYGFDKNEFMQLTMRDLHPPGEAEEFLESMKCLANMQPVERKLWHHSNKAGETMIVEITSHLIDYFGKTSMQVIINDVTERVRLEKELALQQKLKQQQITEVVLGAQERERFELGQELHDNINQILATSKLYLDVAIEEPEPRIELLAKSRKNISMAIEEIRKLSKELITPTLNDLGLVQSIKELIRTILSVKKMKIRLNVSGLDENTLLPEQRINVYRIIQEQLNNILKHAQATTVIIELNKEKEQISLLVKDDGKGFDPRVRRKGVGISNIISRAELYNGKVEIDSAPGKGCRLEVILNSKALPEQ